MTTRIFGFLQDDAPVHQVTLKNKKVTARFLSWGAVLQDLRLNMQGQLRPVVLGFRKLSEYLTYSRNHGATVGRYGGRIRDARLVIDGQTHPLSRNLSGRHHLHGGTVGLGRRNWQLEAADQSSVTFTITSADGDEGYPGDICASCQYALQDTALIVTITATASQKTPLNFLHHSYFNLDGRGQIHDHSLQILGETYIEFDDAGLPTGQILPVAGTRFDFRRFRKLPAPAHFDTSYVLAGGLHSKPRLAGVLQSSRADLSMAVHTTEPGLHFYSGFAAQAPVSYLDGRLCLPETGLCLEATRFNDAVNMPQFGDVMISPSQPYVQRTEFHFTPL